MIALLVVWAILAQPMPNLEKDLRAATRGMTFRSETDEPVLPFVVRDDGRGRITAATARRVAGNPEGRARAIPFDRFFGPLGEEHDWFGAVERADARCYRELQELLENSLTDLHIFRFGTTEIVIIVIGRAPDGSLAGVRTRALET